MHCFIGFTFAFEIDHVQQGGRGWEVGGTVTRLGGHGPRMPPLGYVDYTNIRLGYYLWREKKVFKSTPPPAFFTNSYIGYIYSIYIYIYIYIQFKFICIALFTIQIFAALQEIKFLKYGSISVVSQCWVSY